MRTAHYLPLWIVVMMSLVGCQQPQPTSGPDLGDVLGGEAQAGFARAMEPRPFRFPQDHHAHPAFRNEWWYVTGNVHDREGRRFGYQVTLFRIALSPASRPRQSAWGTNQVWMAHVALTDVQAHHHWQAQRLARGALGLAGQEDRPFRVWLEDWQIVGRDDGEFPWTISVHSHAFDLQLELTPQKPVVLQGDRGLSRKGSEPGNASYYYSLTRLATRGTIRSADVDFAVAGDSWLDREWSTSALGDQQAGWDWFSLQLEDGQELMYYRIRDRQGRTDAHSAGKWVFADGSTQSLGAEAVSATPLRYWTAASGRRYPVQWRLAIPSLNREVEVTALLEDQQMRGGIVYWEGAVQLRDPQSGRAAGYGYVELTGY